MLLLSLYITWCRIELQQLTGVDKSFLIKRVLYLYTHIRIFYL